MGDMADFANESGDRAEVYYDAHPEERCEECGASMSNCKCQEGSS
jgi:hypothetical protein